MSNTEPSGCRPRFNDKLEENEHQLHLRLMKTALKNADAPFLGLAEPSIAANGTRRLHEGKPLANDQSQAQTRTIEEIVMEHADFIQVQRKAHPQHTQVELPRIAQYDLYHLAESMPETRSGAHNDSLHSFFYRQEAIDTMLDHCQYFLDRQGFIMLMWHAFHPVWDNWNFYQITNQTGAQGEVKWHDQMNDPFNMLHLQGTMSRADQQKIIKRTIDGFWSSASTDSKALSFRKKLDHIVDFAKSLATRKGSAIFRPYHEHSPGSWFWWCLENLDDDPVEAARLYRKLFHKTREYLEGQGVDNLLYCYSPDVPHSRFFSNKGEFLAHYQKGMPDVDQLDVLGIDAYLWKLYYDDDKLEYANTSAIENEVSRTSAQHSILARPWERALQMCTWLREEYPDKIVGLTETGWNYSRWGKMEGEPIETFWQRVGMQRLLALPKQERPHFVNFWRNDNDCYHPWNNGSDIFAQEAIAIVQGMDTQVADIPLGPVTV